MPAGRLSLGKHPQSSVRAGPSNYRCPSRPNAPQAHHDWPMDRLSGLTVNQGEVLRLLAKGRIRPWMAPHIELRCGPLASLRSWFLEVGLTRNPTPAELLAEKFKAIELQAILRERALPVSGRKSVLASRIVEALPKSQVDLLTDGVDLTCLTAAGTAAVEALDEELAIQESAVEAEAFQLLFGGSLRAAAARIVRYVDQRLLPHPAEGFLVTLGNDDGQVERRSPADQDPESRLHGYVVAADLLAQPHSELPELTADYRRRVAAALTLSALLSEDDCAAACRVEALTPRPFSCPEAEQFLRTHPLAGRASQFEADDPSAVAEIYAHTKLAEAWCAFNLRECLKSKAFGRGVQISAIEDCPCSICIGKKKCYAWSELEQLPRLPRHWGCRCCYTFWPAGSPH